MFFVVCFDDSSKYSWVGLPFGREQCPQVFLSRKMLNTAHPSSLKSYYVPGHPVIFSADDWGVQSPPKHSI